MRGLMDKMEDKVYVIATYSWGEAPDVFECDSQNEAESLLIFLYNNEHRIEVEENLHRPGEDMKAGISTDIGYAFIKINTNNGVDTTLWYIVDYAKKASECMKRRQEEVESL